MTFTSKQKKLKKSIDSISEIEDTFNLDKTISKQMKRQLKDSENKKYSKVTKDNNWRNEVRTCPNIK